jgi:hypothetical protein
VLPFVSCSTGRQSTSSASVPIVVGMTEEEDSGPSRMDRPLAGTCSSRLGIRRLSLESPAEHRSTALDTLCDRCTVSARRTASAHRTISDHRTVSDPPASCHHAACGHRTASGLHTAADPRQGIGACSVNLTADSRSKPRDLQARFSVLAGISDLGDIPCPDIAGPADMVPPKAGRESRATSCRPKILEADASGLHSRPLDNANLQAPVGVPLSLSDSRPP